MEQFCAKEFLGEITQLPGVSGNEAIVANHVEQAFSNYCEKTWQDSFFNVYGQMDGDVDGARVMLLAHSDEIGMMVTDILEDGFLRFTSVGGIDRRILPAQEVVVWGKGGAHRLTGIIGARPPHVQNRNEMDTAIKMEDLSIDIGMNQQRAREHVSVGDFVTFYSPMKQLQGDTLACKTMDDRACIAVLLETMRELKSLRFAGEAIFTATCQEEVGSHGAKIAAYTHRPDIAIALDVTHGDVPDAPPDSTFPLDKPSIAVGPNIHPLLVKQLRKVAKENRIEFTVDPTPGPTWTDASETQISRRGIPTVLVEIPLRYMHTTVETLRYNTVLEAARWLAHFIASLGPQWEEYTCL